MKIKKILMCLSIVFTLAVAGVVGFACNDYFSNKKSNAITINESTKYKKPPTITYAPNTIQVQRGGNNISYSYVPNLDLKEGEADSTNVIAYEYAIGNSMNNTTTGVNLKSIKTDGVNVSYYYSDKQLDTTESITGETSFTLQELENNGDIIYIYILVSPEDTSVPTDFTTNVVWYYGVPTTMSLINVKTDEKTEHKIIKGQEIDERYLEDVEVPEGKEIRCYLDQKQATPTTLPYNSLIGEQLYYRVASIPNLPSDWIGWDSTLKTYYVKQGTSTLPADLVIPELYTTDTYGTHLVTYINSGSSASDGVFFYKSSLTSVELPSTLTSIPKYTFYCCSGLTSVDLSNCTQLSTIGNMAFYDCDGLANVDLSNCSQLTNIVQEAFKNCNGLVNVDLSNCSQLTTIGTYAFQNCSVLTGITIPSSVTSIGGYAFYDCSGLVSADLSNCSQLTSIGISSFYNCKALTSIDLSNCTQLTTLSEKAFYQCKALASVDLSNCTKLESIGTYAFYQCTGLTELDLSNCRQLTSMGARAFYYCSALTSVDLSGCSQLTNIGNSTFYNCSALTGVYISDIASWCNIDFGNNSANPLYIAKNLYLNGDLVTSVTIPSSVTELKPYVFYNCKSLTSVTIPASVTSIGQSAFCYSGLTSVAIPSSITSIGGAAFSCGALTGVYISDIASWCNIGFSGYMSNPLYYAENLYLNGELVTSITIPSSVTEIKPYTFYNCKSLTSVTLHNNITSIGEKAFHWCEGLTNIDLSICNQLTSIGGSAFSYCEDLTGNITIPSSVTSIGESAFSKCGKITGITVESGNSIYDSRNNCNAIIETATNTLIRGCNNTIMPNDIQVIAERAFDECKNLTSITIPTSVLSIGRAAFEYCSNLKEVYINDMEAWLNMDIDNYNASASPLNNGANLYLNNELVTSITIPDSMTELRQYLFYGCTSITTVMLHNNITSIGSHVFYNCTSLTSIIVPASVTKIGGYVFYGCNNLTSLTFEEDGTWYYGTETQQNNMSGGTEYPITAGTDYSTAFKTTYCNKYWYKK